MGSRAATIATSRILKKAETAFRMGRSPLGITRVEFQRSARFLRDAMTASYLAGLARLYRSLPQKQQAIAASTGLFEGVLEVLKRRLSMTAKKLNELQKEFQTSAAKVFDKASYDTEQQLQKFFLKLVEEEVHVKQGIRRLRAKFRKLGISPRKRHTVEAIFRTQINLAYSAAQGAAEIDPDIARELWGYKYVTVGDDRVRQSHRAMDGVTLPKGHPFWTENRPPNGWNCRCLAIPIFTERGWEEPRKMEDGTQPRADKGFRFNSADLFRKPKGV